MRLYTLFVVKNRPKLDHNIISSSSLSRCINPLNWNVWTPAHFLVCFFIISVSVILSVTVCDEASIVSLILPSCCLLLKASLENTERIGQIFPWLSQLRERCCTEQLISARRWLKCPPVSSALTRGIRCPCMNSLGTGGRCRTGFSSAAGDSHA